MALRKDLPKFDLSQLSYSEKLELLKELEMKESQLKKYRISSFKPISDSQEKVIQSVYNAVEGKTPTKIIWANGGNSGGKCFRVGEEVLNYKGQLVKVENLSVGDYLLGPDSLPRRITKLSYGTDNFLIIKANGLKDVYVTREHRLMLIDEEGELQEEYSHLKQYLPSGRLYELSVKEYLAKQVEDSKCFSKEKIPFGRLKLVRPKLRDLTSNIFCKEFIEFEQYVFDFTIEHERRGGKYVSFELDKDHLHLDKNYIVHHNSAISSFCTASVALGELTKEIGARYIGERKRIAIFVENFAGVRKLEEYMFEEPTFRTGSGHTGLARIPPEFIANIEYSQTKPKAIRYVKLTNGTTIEFNTYNQGYNSAAGGNYDFIWMDEPPQDENVFNEIIARLSRSHCILLFSATLTNDRMDYIDDFFANMDEEQKQQVEIITLLSKDNKHTDTTILRALGEHRLTGRKPEKKGKVYYQFYKGKHIVEHFEPTYENMGGYCKYYMGIDPGGSHPFAIILFCIDEEGMIYIFKEYLLRDAEQAYSNVISIIEENYNKYPFEKIIVDMRDAYFIKTLKQDAQLRNVQKCDKHTKGPRGENNIVWRRMRVNEYFAQGKIMISNRCSELIQEFDRLKYKKNASENASAKSDIDGEDDGIDAFGYAFDYATKNIGMSKLIIKNRYQRPQIETKKNNITPTNNSWNDRKLHSLNVII